MDENFFDSEFAAEAESQPDEQQQPQPRPARAPRTGVRELRRLLAEATEKLERGIEQHGDWDTPPVIPTVSHLILFHECLVRVILTEVRTGGMIFHRPMSILKRAV